tara:strand:- start:66 stop:467 length:402 start_codon:yes stop_codon:yes gene_type:complete
MFLFRHFSSIKSKLPITITDNGWNKIIDIINKSNGNSMLFSAIGGGCNGFNYNLKLISKNSPPNNIDTFTMVNNGNVKVYIDPLSELYLIGTTIDYQTEDFNKNIYESKFLFLRDKNSVSTCGCGVSFLPKNI